MTGRRQNSINSGDDEHCRHHRRKDEALILQLHLGKGWKFLELKSKAAESWKHKVLRICVVSGKPSRKSDGNKFEKLLAWCLVLLTHVDIFGRLVNLLMTLNKMGDSVPLKLALPGLKYPIGSEPNERFLQMGTHATNETHASPIAQQSTATPILTPNQTQQATNETLASPIAQQSIETQVSLEGNFSH
ncbi:hypothetical protein F2Q69_00048125 [Brassica cretica]|uniref:Uncharacterized protein n=1 Tax=Brassica cretica TaxID=69181 RepID=A0A8S9PUC8_BRACR|nr:hypothetical protein F2Q69_00048125 [Brassica cretica]